MGQYRKYTYEPEKRVFTLNKSILMFIEMKTLILPHFLKYMYSTNPGLPCLQMKCSAGKQISRPSSYLHYLTNEVIR